MRRYHFPTNGAATPETDHAGRTLLATLGVLLLAERLARGLDLRAGAELDTREVRWLERSSTAPDRTLEVTPEAAREAFMCARDAAVGCNLSFALDVHLKASAKLEALVRVSQEPRA